VAANGRDTVRFAGDNIRMVGVDGKNGVFEGMASARFRTANGIVEARGPIKVNVRDMRGALPENAPLTYPAEQEPRDGIRVEWHDANSNRTFIWEGRVVRGDIVVKKGTR
jgi:hypothetical protein